MKKVFISYSHDSEEHKNWVSKFALDLRKLGLEVIYDQDLRLGADVAHFMETNVTKVDRVLMICTEPYVQKANDLRGGVGYEKQIITAELLRNLKSTKFVPIIRQISGQNQTPVFLSSRLYIDFSSDHLYTERLKQLVGDLVGDERNLTAIPLEEIQRNSSEKIKEYEKSFFDEYSPHVEKLIPFHCTFQKQSIFCDRLWKNSNYKENILILGPSGCGKSMLGRKLAIELFNNDQVPFLIDVKFFDGNLQSFLDSEVAILSKTSFEVLASFCSIHNKKVVFILDALNESDGVKRALLIRHLRELSSRYSARIIAISQENYDELKSLNMQSLDISEPDLELRTAIASAASIKQLTKDTLEVLKVTHNGFEAKIAGQLNNDSNHLKSRFSFFDQYARNLLEHNDATDGIRALSILGQYSNTHLSYVVPVVEFERLFDGERVLATTVKKLLTTNLLKKQNQKISFGHELLLNAFCAEAAIRNSKNDYKNILEAISLPRHSTYKDLILGAIQNLPIQEKVLNEITDPDLITASFHGLCGEFASKWAINKIGLILHEVKDEVINVQFRTEKDSWMGVAPKPETLKKWTEHERALIQSVPAILVTGKFVDEFYEIASLMDEKIANSFNDLITEAREQKIALRSALFAETFQNQNSQIAFCKISAFISLQYSLRAREAPSNLKKWVADKLSKLNMGDGQFFVLIKLARANRDNHIFSGVIADFILDRWKKAPYHLRIEVLDLVHSFGEISNEEKHRLIAAIETIDTSNIMMSTAVIEALKALGGMDEHNYEEVVKNELNEIFKDPENPEHWRLAKGMYDAQFDHPYDAAYWTVLHNLPTLEKTKFMSMVIRHHDAFVMFTSTALVELLELGDKETAAYITHWTAIPPRPNPIPQDSVQVFMIAHIVLGKFGSDLPPKQYGISHGNDAMNALAEIYYWVNRIDLSLDTRKHSCDIAWDILHKHELGLAMSTFYEFSRSYGLMPDSRLEDVTIFEVFPDKVSEVCRHAILNRTSQRENYFQWRQIDETLSYAMALLGDLGNKADITLLQKLADDPTLGRAAVEAIKKIEVRG